MRSVLTVDTIRQPARSHLLQLTRQMVLSPSSLISRLPSLAIAIPICTPSPDFAFGRDEAGQAQNSERKPAERCWVASLPALNCAHGNRVPPSNSEGGRSIYRARDAAGCGQLRRFSGKRLGKHSTKRYALLRTAADHGTLNEVLEDAGYEREAGSWRSPAWVALERHLATVGA